MENEQADAGRDGQIRLARTDSLARLGTGKNPSSQLSSADHEEDWQPYLMVDPYSALHSFCQHAHFIPIVGVGKERRTLIGSW